jgi:hypothetical protein
MSRRERQGGRMIFNLIKPVPAQDEPTMYLYGREADKTVNCNGIILPSLPEWNNPYAVMVYDTNKVRLVVASEPFVARETEYSWVEVYMNAGTVFEMWYGTHDNLEYLGATATTNTYTASHVYENFDRWSNHDICFEDGTIFISASAPVTETPTAYIGDVGYVGAVLPPLPEWDKEQYAYAVICKYLNVLGSVIGYDIVVSNRPLFMTKGESPHLWQPSGTNSSITMSAKLYLDRTVDDTPPGEWGKWGSPYDSYGPGARWWDEPIWANYDVELCDGFLHPMGETALSASEPIPVELVGYSYNGTVLPELPEWDKETYPYAWIRPYAFGRLLSIQKDVSYAVVEGYENIEYPEDTKFYWTGNSGEWIVDRYDRDNMITRGAIWANFDILSTTGAVTLLASNPIPVYE